MIWTLRITSVVAGLLAAGLLMVFSMYGVEGDPETAQLLGLPTVIEQFRQRAPVADSGGQGSLLEELARGFSRMIDPPAPRIGPGSDTPVRPGVAVPFQSRPRPSAKFKLLATSYHPSDPNLSRALIELDTVDRRQVWVRVGQSLEHYKITEIKDGSISYGDGSSVQVVEVEPRPAKVSLLAGPQPRPRQSTAAPAVGSVRGPVSPTRPVQVPVQPISRQTNPNLPAAVRPQSDADVQRVEQYVQTLQSLPSQSDDPQQERIRQEVLEKLGSYIEAARLSQEQPNVPDQAGVGPDQNQLPGAIDPGLIQ